MTSTLCKTGIDALDFLNQIPADIINEIDTVILDPPYLEKLNSDTWKKKHGGSIVKLGEKAYNKTEHINDIVFKVIDLLPNAKTVTFHTNIEQIDTSEKVIIWYKPDIPLKNLIGNVEYITLHNVKNNGIHFKSKVFAIPREINTRSMSKPVRLWEELFNLIKPRFVIDLFAGYGNIIRVCRSRNINIYACDIDEKLQSVWDGHLNQKSLEDFD